jgi:hypothetical protein
MARPDLTNEQVEEMGREEPGSAARYLEERREELAAEKQAERERDDYRRFEEAFVERGELVHRSMVAGRDVYGEPLDLSD